MQLPGSKGGESPLSAIRAAKCQLEDQYCGKGLTAAQPLQDRRRGETIRNQAAFRLEITHRDTGLVAEPPVRLADVEAVPVEVLLQFEPLGAGEHALVARPGLRDRRAAAPPV